MALYIPYTFSDGDLIVASQFNDNFASLDQRTQWVTPEMFGGDIQAAIDSLSGGGTITIATPQTLTASLTIPANISLQCLQPGVITVPTGGTLTINGPFTAGLYQVFAGSGTVVFGDGATFIHPEWFPVGMTLPPEEQLVKSSDGSGLRYVALRGGKGGTPRLYIMPYHSGESDVKAALKIFSSDYITNGTSYNDLGLYYSNSDKAFAINSKSTYNSSVSGITSIPINVQFNDLKSNTALSAFMGYNKNTAKTITGVSITGGVPKFTVASHGYTYPTWVYISGITGTLSAINDQWYTIKDTMTGDTFEVNYDATGLTYTSGGSVQSYNSSPAAAPAICIGGSRPTDVTFFPTTGLYHAKDSAFIYNNMLRFYNSDNSSAGTGIKTNSSHGLDFYVAGSKVFSLSSGGMGLQLYSRLLGTAGDTTPDVSATNFLQIPSNGGVAYNVTDFVNGADGQELTILFSDVVPTVVHSSGLKLNGSVNFVPTSGSTLTLIHGLSGWFEKSRSKP